MFSAFLFILYFILLLWLLRRVTIQMQVPVNSTELSALFAFKILTGCLYGYIYLHFYHGDDTWMLFTDSVDDYHRLLNNPASFLNDLSPDRAFANVHSFREGWEAYLTALEYWLM